MKSLRKFTCLLTLLATCFFAKGQNPISGKVTDSTGNGLEGINIIIKGTTKGTSTLAGGVFSIDAPSNATLIISGIGFSTQEVKIGGRSNIPISLSSSTGELSTVVVTALGITKQERKLGYAVTSVGGDQMTKARETNVALSLSGQVAGLDVHGTNGGPGGTARILLRGMPSINSGGSPLFVINGVPMDNSNRGGAGEWGGADMGDGIGNINPDDIATMTILKGQAASALYGARASNGVILITTKKGKKGSSLVEYNSNYVVDKIINYQNYQWAYGQGQNGNKPANATEARNTDRLSWGAKLDGSPVIGYDGNQYVYSAFKDNLKNFYRTGPTFTNTVSVSGGGDNGNYRISASNLSNKSIVLNSGIERKTINLNLNQNVTKKLSVNFVWNYIDEQDKNRPFLSDGPENPNNFQFLATNVNENIFRPGYDANGYEIVFSDDNYVTNPWFVVNKFIDNSSRKRLIASLSAKYDFTDWLYAMARVGYDSENDRYIKVEPTGTNYTFNSKGQSGSINLSNAQTTELNVDGLLGVKHKITEDFNFDATLGANLRKNRFESIGVSGGPFVVEGLYTPGNVVSFGRSYGFNSKEVHSAFYSLDFSYKNFLTLNTTGRYDAYSTLYYSGIPTDQRNIFTPSVSASFIFTELMHINSLNYGKLRASYAQTSGEPGSAYQTAVYPKLRNRENGLF